MKAEEEEAEGRRETHRADGDKLRGRSVVLAGCVPQAPAASELTRGLAISRA